MQVPFNIPDTQVDNRIPVQVHGFHSFKYRSSAKKTQVLIYKLFFSVSSLCTFRFNRFATTRAHRTFARKKENREKEEKKKDERKHTTKEKVENLARAARQTTNSATSNDFKANEKHLQNTRGTKINFELPKSLFHVHRGSIVLSARPLLSVSIRKGRDHNTGRNTKSTTE